jgi:hypothetical protein
MAASRIWTLGVGGWLLAIFAQAAESELTLQHSEAAELTVREAPVLFSERVVSAFERRADPVFADRLHSFKMMRITLLPDGSEPDDFQERTASAAQSGLSKAITYSLRDAVAESPLMVWLAEREERVAAFLRDTIDGVEEESISPLDASYGVTERSWWRSLKRNGGLRYGLRPFRSSPYAFTSFAFKENDQALFFGHVRYYYDDLNAHKFEFAMSLPLMHGYALDLGTSYRLGSHETPGRMALKIVRELRWGGILHFGFELKNHPLALAGITFPW